MNFLLFLILWLLPVVFPVTLLVIRILTDKKTRTAKDQEQEPSPESNVAILKRLKSRLAVLLTAFVYAIAITVLFFLAESIRDILIHIPILKNIVLFLENPAQSQAYAYRSTVLYTILFNILIGLVYLLLPTIQGVLLAPISKLRAAIRRKRGKKDGERKKDPHTELSEEQAGKTRLFRWFGHPSCRLVGDMLLVFTVIFACFTLLLFLFYCLPVFFDTKNQVVFRVLNVLFEAGYHYPVITLILLIELSSFLRSGAPVEPELADADDNTAPQKNDTEFDPLAIANKMRKGEFGSYYLTDYTADSNDPKEPVQDEEKNYGFPTDQYREAVAADKRNSGFVSAGNAEILRRMFCTESADDFLIEGGFFSPLGALFLRTVATVVTRGEKIIFLCQNDTEVDAVQKFTEQGLARISSLYEESGSSLFDKSIWTVEGIKSDFSTQKPELDNVDILITVPEFVCSRPCFLDAQKSFIKQTYAVVFPELADMLDTHAMLLSLICMQFSRISDMPDDKNNPGHLIRYFGFTSNPSEGIDNVWKNIWGDRTIKTANCSEYSEGHIVHAYRYGLVDIKGNNEYLDIISCMNEVCRKEGLEPGEIFLLPAAQLPTFAFNETLTSYGTNISQNGSYRFDGNEYKAIIVFDSLCSLPDAVRRAMNMVGENRSALIFTVSKPYMMLEYYASHKKNWRKCDFRKILEFKHDTPSTVALKVLNETYSAGITDEMLRMRIKNCPTFCHMTDPEEILLSMLGLLLPEGKLPRGKKFTDFFSYKVTSEIDNKHTTFDRVERIVMNEDADIFERLEQQQQVTLRRQNGSLIYHLPVSRDRISQKFIPKQCLVWDGDMYTIEEVDYENAEITVRLPNQDDNARPYEYDIIRRYALDSLPSQDAMVNTIGNVLIRGNTGHIPAEVITTAGIAISPYQGPIFVSSEGSNRETGPSRTTWYGAELQKQLYRRYGTPQALTEGFGGIEKSENRVFPNSEMRYVLYRIRRPKLITPENRDKITFLVTVMINELMRTMFPHLADVALALPYIPDPEMLFVIPEEPEEDGMVDSTKEERRKDDENTKREKISAARSIYEKRCSLVCKLDEERAEDEIVFLLCEDSPSNVGFLDMMDPLHDKINIFFDPIYKYLNWYLSSEDHSRYLWFGSNYEPICFDFEALYRLARELVVNTDRVEEEEESEHCVFCGKTLSRVGNGRHDFRGRIICEECYDKCLQTQEDAYYKEIEHEAYGFIQKHFNVEVTKEWSLVYLDDESMQKRLAADKGLEACTAYRGVLDVENKTAYMEKTLPSLNLRELTVRMLTRIWQYDRTYRASPEKIPETPYTPRTPEDVFEAQVSFVGIQLLESEKTAELARVIADRRDFYSGKHPLCSVGAANGYRYLMAELGHSPDDSVEARQQKKRKFRNNSFYLISVIFDDDKTEPIVITIGDSELGNDVQDDPAFDGKEIEPFYYSHMSPADKPCYDKLLAAVKEFRTEVDLGKPVARETVFKLLQAVVYDHPEYYYYDPQKYADTGNGTIRLCYGIDQAKYESQMREIEEACRAFEQPILDKEKENPDQKMSAYMKALTLYHSIAALVEYDNEGLDQQSYNTYNRELDYLRNIYGAIVEKRSVCAGYAIAYQFLLRRHGIESIYCAGPMAGRHYSGPYNGHAWNIIRLGGKYYHVDITWDDATNRYSAIHGGDSLFKYFCVTTEEIERTRRTDWCPYPVPECTAIDHNHQMVNHTYYTSYDKKAIKKRIKEARKANERVLSVKFELRGDLSSFESDYPHDTGMTSSYYTDGDLYLSSFGILK